MRLIAREAVYLRSPDRHTIRHVKDQVRDLHAAAYGWDPPALEGEDDPALRMRQHVRQWINEWDLTRSDPAYTAHTVVSEVAMDYTERAELETPIEGDAPAEPFG
jgi:hypothetical protein